ncbi:MAG: penicillin-binding protein 2, partial [Chloroflexi bacterium]|nr:penicillin-binding protein 2 [Chloroflexota bacterium]
MKFQLFRVIILLSFGAIVFQLFQLQIGSGDYYRRLADYNRFRLVADEGPRGVIYDRNGSILARNSPTYAIAILPADLPDDKAQRAIIYNRLSSLLKIPASARLAAGVTAPSGVPAPARFLAGQKSIEELVEEARSNPFAYLTLKSRVARETADIVEEQRLDLPGVYVLREATRTYLPGENMAHLLGYTGGIPADRLKDYEAQGYELNDRVGLSGVERIFESDLRGTQGRRLVEVDASGREIRTLASEPAEPGNNVVLTLDVNLQNAAVQALKAGLKRSGAKAGALIAMNPNNGELLAMVSWPSYDDNLFADGISADDYAALLQNPQLPLFNRAISGEYPLGSVFKIVPAAAALQENVIDARTGVVDSGVIWLPNKFYPDDQRLAQPFYGWARQGLGLMNVTSALAWSSDIFFYEISGGFQDLAGLGLERLAYYAQLFGFGVPTGIAVPGEAQGLVPNDRWKRLNYAQSWVTGDTYNMGIGQGFLLGTPLQMLNATAAVVNGGTLYKPQIARGLVDVSGRIVSQTQPEIIRQLPVSPQSLALVREGLRAVVTGGTAQAINLAAVQIAGKTGTAEFPGRRDSRGRLPTHAWFTAFAPYEHPEIALVVFVENGGEGSITAVPIAADFLKAYFHLPKDAPLVQDKTDVPVPGPQLNESPQAGAIVPYRPADAPPTYRVRVLAQE